MPLHRSHPLRWKSGGNDGPCDCISQCGLTLPPHLDYLHLEWISPLSATLLRAYHLQKICKFSAAFLQKFFPPRAMSGCKHSYWHSGMRSESGVAGIRCESLLHFVSPMFLFEDDVCAPGFVTDKYRALTCHTFSIESAVSYFHFVNVKLVCCVIVLNGGQCEAVLNISPDFVSCGKLVMSTLWLKLYIICCIHCGQQYICMLCVLQAIVVYMCCVYCGQGGVWCVCPSMSRAAADPPPFIWQILLQARWSSLLILPLFSLPSLTLFLIRSWGWPFLFTHIFTWPGLPLYQL